MFAGIRRRRVYISSLLHILIAFFYSFFFFKGLLIDTGIENKAYSYLWSGNTLQEDKLSRIFCIFASYLLAAVFIWLFWRFLLLLGERVRKKQLNAILFLIILIAGCMVVLLLYPEMFGVETTDDFMNYAYAREFLPMYWHGFLTNVVYCACMIFFPHPVSIPIIQFLFGLSSFFYIGNILMERAAGRKWLQAALTLSFILLPVLLPETIRILICPTRNCMYAIVVLWAMGILFGDYFKDKEPSKQKFVLLCFLFAVLGSWRGEGILYLLAFPFLFYFTYEFKKQKSCLSKVHGKQLIFYIIICFLFMLPDKYGVNKYQNSDYMIANTTGPISAVLHDEAANISYKGAKEDLEHIAQVVPAEYIYEYGCNGGFYWNAVSGRWVRQSGVTKEEGKEYISSAYRLLGHNLSDYLKYQWNLFADANSVKVRKFSMDFGKEIMENALELSPYIRAFELYDAGEASLSGYDLKLISKEAKALLLKYVLLDDYKKSLNDSGIAGIVKLALVGIMLFTALWALVQRNYWYFLSVLLNLAVLAVIILMAPWSRPNYYYYTFEIMYWNVLQFFMCKK